MSDSVTPWTITCQAPLSMEFSRQEYWSGLPFPSLGDLSNPEIEPRSPALQADSLPSEPAEKPQHSRKVCRFHAHPSSSTRDLSWRNKFVGLCGDGRRWDLDNSPCWSSGGWMGKEGRGTLATGWLGGGAVAGVGRMRIWVEGWNGFHARLGSFVLLLLRQCSFCSAQFLPLAFLLAPVPQLWEWLHGCVYGCPWPILSRPPHRMPLPIISVLAVLSVWATLNCRSASELRSTEPTWDSFLEAGVQSLCGITWMFECLRVSIDLNCSFV